MIKIVTDSSVQLTPEEITQNNITVVPLSIEINGQNYIDGETISRQEVVDALAKGHIPKSSQPPMGKFVEVFDQLGQDGSEVVAIVLSDVLSGTFNTAQSAAQMTDTKVTVINSKSTDRGLAFQVLAAAKDAQAGKSVQEIQAHCAQIAQRTTIDVLVDSLDCLVAGGRVSKMAGMLTKLINIKVVVRLTADSLDVVAKGRSRKTFVKYCEQLAQNYQSNEILELSLSNVAAEPDFLSRIKQALIGERTDVAYLARLTSPIIMTHTGLNAIGVITLRKDPVTD